MKTIRPADTKIQDIKAIRGLTRLLGKFHLPSCYRQWPDEGYRQWCQQNNVLCEYEKLHREEFGWGLKDSKDYVEYKYDYKPNFSRSVTPSRAPARKP